MEQEWQQDNCEEIKALATSFPIIEAALRWCEVPDEMIEEIRREAKPKSATGVGIAIWTHPAVPCLEARSALIARAIEQEEMPQAREDGLPAKDHVAHERRHVLGETLRDWMVARHQSERPSFLFPVDYEPQTVDEEKSRSTDLRPRSETTYLHIIAALLGCLKGEVPGFGSHPGFVSEKKLISLIADKYGGYSGISVSNLSRKLPEARKSLEF